MKHITMGLSLAFLISGCATHNDSQSLAAAYNSINETQLAGHIKTLASDEFEGRAPSTKGEELTLN